jgi:cobalt-zinc-cadmium efflux system outer membrane protein
MARNLFNLFLLFVAFAGSLAAAEYSLTIAEVEKIAGERSLAMQAQRADVLIARADVRTSALWDNPEISAQYDYHQITSAIPNNPATFDVRLSQPLQLFGLRGARVDQATAGVIQAGLLTADFERNFILQMRLTSYKALVLSNALSFQKAFYENYQKLLQANAFRYKKGDISEYELKKLEVEGTRYENSIAGVEIELRRRLNELKKGLSLGESDVLRIQDDLKQPVAEEVLAILDKKVEIELRSDLLAAQNEITLAERGLTVAEKETMPDFSLATQYHYEPRSSPFAENHYLGLSLTVPLKVFNRNQGKREAYLQLIEKKKIAYRQQLMSARTELDVQRSAIKQYLGVLENGKTRLALSKEIYEKGRLLYTKKAANLIQLLESERSYFEMQREFFEILYNFQESLEIYIALTKTMQQEKNPS